MKSFTLLALLGLITAQQEIEVQPEHQENAEVDTYMENYDTSEFHSTCRRVKIRNVESTQFITQIYKNNEDKSSCARVGMGGDFELFNKYQEMQEGKTLSQVQATNDVFEVVHLEEGGNVQFKGPNGLLLHATQGQNELGCSKENEPKSEKVSTSFGVIKGELDGAWFIGADFGREIDSRFLSLQYALYEKGEVNALISLDSIEDMRKYSRISKNYSEQW